MDDAAKFGWVALKALATLRAAIPITNLDPLNRKS